MKKLILPLIAGSLPMSLSAQLVINEILFDPGFSADDASFGDANGDGTRSATEDEFVELVNVGDVALDLTGWTVSDALGVKHTFTGGILAPGQAVVIFGGGVPTGSFGGSLVVVASEGTLGLANGGDSVFVNDPLGAEVGFYSYVGGEVNDESLALSTELDNTSAYIGHSAVVGSGGALYSPGTLVSGTPFGGDALSILITPAAFSEAAGVAAAAGTVTRTGDTSSELLVTLTSGDPTEATVPATVTIMAGSASADFVVDAVDDAEQDAAQSVTISASGADIFSGSFTVTVEDDEAPIPTFTLTADPATISENGGSSLVTLEISASSATGYTFNLSSADTSELSVPATVTVAPDATMATFTATGVDDAISDGAANIIVTASDPDGVILDATVSILVTDDEGFQAPDVVINEIRIDDVGTDDDEYIELYSPTDGDVSLDRLTVVMIGDSTAGSGVVERAIDLSGQTLSGNYFLIGSDIMLLATPDLSRPANFLENSDNVSIFIVTDFTGVEGEDLDADDDGTLETKPWTEIISGVSLVEEANIDDGNGGFFKPGGTEWDYSADLGLPAIGPDGAFVPGHVFRSPNGTGDWQIGPFVSIEGDPDADPPIEAVTVLDSPGAENSDSVGPPEGNDPQIIGFSINMETGQATLTVTGLGTKIWLIQSSDDLGFSDVWEPIGGFSEVDNPDGSTNLLFFDTFSVTPKRFYRLIEQP